MLKHVFSCSYERCSKILSFIFDIDFSRLSSSRFSKPPKRTSFQESDQNTPPHPDKCSDFRTRSMEIASHPETCMPSRTKVQKHACHPSAGEKSRTRCIKPHFHPESWGEITDESLKSGSSSVQPGRKPGRDTGKKTNLRYSVK